MLAVFAGIFAFFGIGWDDIRDRHNEWADRPDYAERVFADLLPITKVLASRQYRHWGPDRSSWDCTYAIVELADDAPDGPVTSARENDGWSFRFGGDWQQTSFDPVAEDTRDAVDYCGKYWPDAVAQRMRLSLSEPGHWFVEGAIGEVIFVYSKQHLLAARIRFGD
ncbi:hypothetical protein Q4544_07340 [Cognatishimia sp. 1_MG-2023]|uniref:hypothetical protein n=1 Tax=Cognatishimia sp. 1_MG-2023 TaxID=3062642 RepID=UPI0026E17BBC|nr:hypothetical protein [Cognatishimia sp. 1_MG-2023]MDO6726739.1 hypothetical protein [Cognatishimia sp. 1_MG-2023]